MIKSMNEDKRSARVEKVFAKLEALVRDGLLTPAELSTRAAGIAVRFSVEQGAKLGVDHIMREILKGRGK